MDGGALVVVSMWFLMFCASCKYSALNRLPELICSGLCVGAVTVYWVKGLLILWFRLRVVVVSMCRKSDILTCLLLMVTKLGSTLLFCMKFLTLNAAFSICATV